MNTQQITREMAFKEREFLENILKSSPTDVKRWMEGAQNALVLWAASMLGIVICWMLLAWLVGLISDVEIGLHSPYAIWIISIAAPLCGVYSIYSSVKWVKSWQDHRPLLRQDIDNGVVIDETYKVTGVKCFQEQEHGGLIYFLQMNDGRVLALYDHESQDLGVDEKDPFLSSFQPCSDLHIVRAPNTGYVVEQKFSGTNLNIPETFDLTIAPENWPEQDAWCDIPWDDLESRL